MTSPKPDLNLLGRIDRSIATLQRAPLVLDRSITGDEATAWNEELAEIAQKLEVWAAKAARYRELATRRALES